MLIVLTSDQEVEHEISLIHQLFKEGLEILHIRKSDYSKDDVRQFIQQIDPEYHSKLVVHKHHELCTEFTLKGIHLKEQYRIDFEENVIDYLNTFSSKGYTVSTSFHNLETLNAYTTIFDYCFLSPVFSSISKQGYEGRKFDVSHSSKKIIALGGIQTDTVETTFDLGYQGVGILGAIWQSKTPIANFKEIQHLVIQRKVLNTIEN